MKALSVDRASEDDDSSPYSMFYRSPNIYPNSRNRIPAPHEQSTRYGTLRPSLGPIGDATALIKEDRILPLKNKARGMEPSLGPSLGPIGDATA